MNTTKNMIIANGQIKTSSIESCKYNKATKKWDIQYIGGKLYSYNYMNVDWLKDPKILDPKMYSISRNGQEFNHIKVIYDFSKDYNHYWHICYENGNEGDYNLRDLKVEKSCLLNPYAENVFSYLKEISNLSEIRNPDNQEKLLPKHYEEIGVIQEDIVLSKYLGTQGTNFNKEKDNINIFPFGCNNSQYSAVKRAMENHISVIQGPPGTGKTQTILNIIANILMQGKTVQIVSNNNAAIDNVFEKLASDKYKLDFIVAPLGRSENKRKFIESQLDEYPDFSEWILEDDNYITLESIREKTENLKKVFTYEEREAMLKQEISALDLELKYFNQYLKETNVMAYDMQLKSSIKSSDLMELWQICQELADKNKGISLWFKIKNFFKYGIRRWDFYKQDISKIITSFQKYFYDFKRKEIFEEIVEITEFLSKSNKNLMQEMCNDSMLLLKNSLAKKYQGNEKRRKFTEEDLWKNSQSVLEEYPVILSTTFSSKSSLNNKIIYDYIIMDEASQVDLATGALALSCARNAIIVGDTKQLPNVVPSDIRQRADIIFNSFKVPEGYKYTKSFLQSVLDVIPDIQQTLLREHYRCHPKIINFCNQKFYNNELIIMTKDCGEENVLKVVKTVLGNHARGHYSQRQIDIIKNEIIPQYVNNKDEIGIIAPYKEQVKALDKQFSDIDVATVHKFQGREKDTIIISTVDDEITDFVDDPYLMNVAISRAKKKLMLVVSGNEQIPERNISDLIAYIKYNNFEVVESEIYSVFDYLYKQYTVARKEYLQSHKRVSEYDSENLMYALISDVLREENMTALGTVCHFPINMLIRDPKLLNDDECKYAMNPATHVDFLIFNLISKKPVMAIEVDGYEFHKNGTVQFNRDSKKDHVLELYGIPLIRLATNGSGEKEILINQLRNISLDS